VSFRYSTMQAAERFRVDGWVRNRLDGTVEAVFEGAKENVESMVAWCRKGPPAADVEHVDVSWETPEQGFKGFRVRL
jgi:acylphosphatase